MGFWVYVLVNPKSETYVGQTSDLGKRLRDHNDPAYDLTLHTKRHSGPWRFLYVEEQASRAEAMKRERQLKSGGGRRFIKRLLEDESGHERAGNNGVG